MEGVNTGFSWVCPECGVELFGDWGAGKNCKWSCCDLRYEIDAAGRIHSTIGLFPYEIQRGDTKS